MNFLLNYLNVNMKVVSIIFIFLSSFSSCSDNERVFVYTIEFEHVYTEIYEGRTNNYERHSIYVNEKEFNRENAPEYYTRLLQLCYCYLDSLRLNEVHKNPVSYIDFYNSKRGFPKNKTGELEWHVSPFFEVDVDSENPISFPTALTFHVGSGIKTINIKAALENFKKEKCTKKYYDSDIPLFKQIQ
ncbi:MAG: hypothetical protein AAGG68_30770 [Bacteroidota bacterium]